MRGARGFTLLEVLIAFAIAALALAALAQAAQGGLRSSRVAAQTEQALSRAKSRLAAAAANPQPGEQSGDDGGGFTWRMLVRPERAGEASTGRDRPVLYDVAVQVSWGAGDERRRVTLETVRLGSAAEAAP